MIEDLQAFVAAVEARSLTKASARLNVTQSAVSRRLQHLEDVLGASLFDRTQRPSSPTALGVRIYEQAVPILRAVEDLAAMAKEKTGPIGIMKLGVAQGIGDLLLTDVVKRLQGAFPQLDLRLRTDWSRGLSQQVAEGELDAALILLPASSRPPARMQGRCLGSVRTHIIQARKSARFRRPVRLLHLANEPWILNPSGCGYRAALEGAMGERDGMLRIAIDTYGTEVQLRMVAAGVGLGLVPLGALKTSAVRRDIATVDVTDFSLCLDAWMVHRRQPGNMRKALEAIAEEMSEGLERLS